MNRVALVFISVLLLAGCNRAGEKVFLVKLTTTHGDIKLKLYNETPGHRDNFLELVKSGFYNDIFFHRIYDGFMIQTGNPETRGSFVEGSDISKYRYTIPAEIIPGLYHKKGALAAARMGGQGNPLRASSGTQFYIVQGVVHTDETLAAQQERINRDFGDNLYFRYMSEEKAAADSAGIEISSAEIQEKVALRMHEYFENNEPYVIPPEQREVYKTVGGTPHLDTNYTVFGEVTEGFDVIDKIAAEPANEAGRPHSGQVRIIRAVVVKK
ncbi:MAG: peptidylprolyl isomerase [Bacteroidetes bacterium]|nr:peptidylprolyl isomerase [Bacteroidota bacterium]